VLDSCQAALMFLMATFMVLSVCCSINMLPPPNSLTSYSWMGAGYLLISLITIGLPHRHSGRPDSWCCDRGWAA
jgi:hypothetical protein